jgi:hypothetical protein
MIAVLLKCRDRGTERYQNIIDNLHFWIRLFSNHEKYKLYLYNENVVLPEYFNTYSQITFLNKQILMNNNEVKVYQNALNASVISPHWRPTAFALGAIYFYLQEDQILINLDSDDLLLEGSALTYMEKTIDYVKNNNLETLSYDMLYSYNGKYASKRHHWTMGLNISNSHKMKNIIMSNMNDKTIDPQVNVGISFDLVVDHYLHLPNYKQQHNCFITPDKLIHLDHGWTKNLYNDTIEVNDYGNILEIPRHPKTLVIE